MTQHRFILQPYKGPASRHTCPQCEKPKTFVRYIDTAAEVDLPDFVGRCGREANCTYHYTPKQFFADYPDHKPGQSVTNFRYMPALTAPMERTQPPCVMDESIVANSLGHYERNNLVQYLRNCLGEDKADPLVALYQIGTSNHWHRQGATVFWQRDEQGRVRGGKLMLYDPATGRRRKEEAYHPTWVHSVLKLADFTLTQCLFGAHQLPVRPKAVVAIVESEKTALIATAYFPGFIWLATGGIANLSIERCQALKGRKVVLFPDLSADGSVYAKWSQKAKELASVPGLQISVSTYLEERADDTQRGQGLDLADFLLAPASITIREPASMQSIDVESLPVWYTAFNLPWAWDAVATMARVRWMVLPPGVEEGSPADSAQPPRLVVTTLSDWAVTPGSILRPDPAQLHIL